MRYLKRRLSDIVYRQMARDAQRLAAGPEGHTGAATNSSAADLDPHSQHFGSVTSQTHQPPP